MYGEGGAVSIRAWGECLMERRGEEGAEGMERWRSGCGARNGVQATCAVSARWLIVCRRNQCVAVGGNERRERRDVEAVLSKDWACE